MTMTRAGYIKSVAAAAFRTQGRGGRGGGVPPQEEDLVSQVVHVAHSYLLLSNQGKVTGSGATRSRRDRTPRGRRR